MSKEAEEFFRQKTIENATRPSFKKFLALVNREQEGKIMQEYADQQLPETTASSSEFEWEWDNKLESTLKEIVKEELITGYNHYLTVGSLKEFLNKHNLPDSAKVVVQRIEDVYYEKHSWGVYLKEGMHTFKDDEGNIVKSSLEQYHPAWCCSKYNDDDDILFINLHY